MTWLLRLLWLVLGREFKRRMRARAASRLRRQGVVVYLRAVMGTRRLLLAALLIYFVLQIVIFAFIGAVVTGLWLWDYDPHLKIQLAFGVCLGLVTLPILFMFVAFSEHIWYRYSGAQKMVDEALSSKEDSRAA